MQKALSNAKLIDKDAWCILKIFLDRYGITEKSCLAKLLPYRKSVPSFDELSLKVKTHESQKDNNGWRKKL